MPARSFSQLFLVWEVIDVDILGRDGSWSFGRIAFQPTVETLWHRHVMARIGRIEREIFQKLILPSIVQLNVPTNAKSAERVGKNLAWSEPKNRATTILNA